MQIFIDNKQMLRLSLHPVYMQRYKRDLLLSKVFTSTVVEIACDLGLLSIDDKIVDIFPEKVTLGTSKNLAKMYNIHFLN